MTVKVGLKMPDCVGMPVMAPVSWIDLQPVGKSGGAECVGAAPGAAGYSEYRSAGVSRSLHTRRQRGRSDGQHRFNIKREAWVEVAFQKSVAVTLNCAETGEVGAEGQHSGAGQAGIRPASVPGVSDQVMGAVPPVIWMVSVIGRSRCHGVGRRGGDRGAALQVTVSGPTLARFGSAIGHLTALR